MANLVIVRQWGLSFPPSKRRYLGAFETARHAVKIFSEGRGCLGKLCRLPKSSGARVRGVRGQVERQALRPVHVRGLQELLQAQCAEEPELHVPRQPELSHRPASPQPVPVLSPQKVPQSGHETGRYRPLISPPSPGVPGPWGRLASLLWVRTLDPSLCSSIAAPRGLLLEASSALEPRAPPMRMLGPTDLLHFLFGPVSCSLRGLRVHASSPFLQGLGWWLLPLLF